MKKLLLCLFLLTPVSGMAMNCEIADVPLCDKAKQGDSEAQVNLGVMYALGQGVEKDYAKAKIWYEKSASQGNSLAQYNLGFLYYHGKGVRKDHTTAKEWFGKSCDAGYQDGCKYYRTLNLRQ